jgi:hypothetical protein
LPAGLTQRLLSLLDKFLTMCNGTVQNLHAVIDDFIEFIFGACWLTWVPDLSRMAYLGVLLAGTTAVTIAVSSVLYRYIEVPGIQIGRALARRLAAQRDVGVDEPSLRPVNVFSPQSLTIRFPRPGQVPRTLGDVFLLDGIHINHELVQGCWRWKGYRRKRERRGRGYGLTRYQSNLGSTGKRGGARGSSNGDAEPRS